MWDELPKECKLVRGYKDIRYLLLDCSMAVSLKTVEKLGKLLLNPESDPAHSHTAP
jgi:hypothetical protein